MNTRKLALFATLTALAVATNYAMMGMWNVKFMDFIVFIGGFSLGSVAGGAMGMLCWAIYGTLNPLGFSLPILLATMFSESLFGIAGGLMRRKLLKPIFEETGTGRINISILIAFIGVLITLTYDLLTNIAWAIVVETNIFVILIAGIPFTIAHLISNAIFFSVASVPVIKIITKNFLGGENSVNDKK